MNGFQITAAVIIELSRRFSKGWTVDWEKEMQTALDATVQRTPTEAAIFEGLLLLGVFYEI